MSSIFSKLINLAGNITGVLKIANGGTNSSAALSNNRVIQSSGGKIVEAAAITASRALVSDANGIPVASATSTTQVQYLQSATGTTGTTSTNVVFSTSPTLVTPNIGAATASSLTSTGQIFVDGSSDTIQMLVQGNATQTSEIMVVEKSDGTDVLQVTNTAGTAIRGTTTNTTVAAGFVGEVKVVSLVRASSNSLSNNVAENLLATTLDLGAGNWQISGCASFVGAATTTTTSVDFALSTTSGTLPATSTIAVPDSNGQVWLELGLAGSNTGVWDICVTLPTYNVSLSGSVSLYLVVRSNFGGIGGTMAAYGSAHARRIY